jgi:hypothetical protein
MISATLSIGEIMFDLLGPNIYGQPGIGMIASILLITLIKKPGLSKRLYWPALAVNLWMATGLAVVATTMAAGGNSVALAILAGIAVAPLSNVAYLLKARPAIKLK